MKEDRKQMWLKIKKEYESGNEPRRKLAEKWGVTSRAIDMRAAKDNWKPRRAESPRARDLVKKAVKKAGGDKWAEEHAKGMKILREMCMKLLSDAEQRVKTGDLAIENLKELAIVAEQFGSACGVVPDKYKFSGGVAVQNNLSFGLDLDLLKPPPEPVEV